MLILRKYIIKEFLYYFLICFLSFILIAVLFSVLTELDIMAKENGMKLFIEAILAGIPLIVEITIPISVLLATNLTFISLNKSLEITAMMAAGISYFQMLLPLIAIGAIISLFSYFNQSYLTVWWKADKHLRLSNLASQDNFWQFYKGKLFFFSQVSPREKQIGAVKIFIFDKNADIAQVNTIEGLKLLKSEWSFQKREEVKFTGDEIIRRPLQTKNLDKDLLESLFREKPAHPKYSNFSDLIAEINLKRERATNYEQEIAALYQKMSGLFAIWVMILLGLPFSLYSGATANFKTGIVLSLLIGFTFWLADQILISLNSAGLVISEISAFGANIIFSLIGFLLIYFQLRGGFFNKPSSGS